MNKENFLFGIVGLLAGLIIGFFVTNSMNRNATTTVAQTPPVQQAGPVDPNQPMPADHPNVNNAQPGQMSPEIQQAIDKAKAEPENFEAQVKAAEFYYQIQRLDQAIEFLGKANKLKPDDRKTLVNLGNANFDAEKWEEAEKWYQQALQKDANDVAVSTDLGLTYMFRASPDVDKAIEMFQKSLALDPNHKQTLQNLAVAYTKKGDAASATETVGKLEKIDPQNQAIQQIKTDIQKIGK
ncbi:MAG: tetratricopeptide repeat protein [Pyrinomonadaceae bacterium]